MGAEETERRHFDRVATDKPLGLRLGDRQLQGKVLDISLRGLLFQADGDWYPALGAPVRASVQLDDDPASVIQMDGEIAHVEGDRIGLRCISIDLESAGRLRRLVELNLADHRLLERNLVELVAG